VAWNDVPVNLFVDGSFNTMLQAVIDGGEQVECCAHLYPRVCRRYPITLRVYRPGLRVYTGYLSVTPYKEVGRELDKVSGN